MRHFIFPPSKIQILLSSDSGVKKIQRASGLGLAFPTKRAFFSYQRGHWLLPMGRSSPTKRAGKSRISWMALRFPTKRANAADYYIANTLFEKNYLVTQGLKEDNIKVIGSGVNAWTAKLGVLSGFGFGFFSLALS